MNRVLTIISLSLIASGCVATTTNEQPCPPKSDTQVIADTISDILVPKIRWGCQ